MHTQPVLCFTDDSLIPPALTRNMLGGGDGDTNNNAGDDDDEKFQNRTATWVNKVSLACLLYNRNMHLYRFKHVTRFVCT